MEEIIKWIPISEQKPMDRERVLITYKWDNSFSEIFIEEWWGNANGNEYGFGLRNKKVVAWARLPRPYKEDIDE